jgi:lincosamide nucleotidyltransferase A/C/D/E
MDAARVLGLLEHLTARDIPVWLDGGWCIDALLGRQTRPHDDLDLLVRFEDFARLERVLRELGYVFVGGDEPDVVEYLVDAEGHQVDVHPISFSEAGRAIYTMADGQEWIYPAGAFTGVGHVLGREVPCLTPEAVMLSHTTGYVLDEDHRRDVAALSERYGITPPELESR